MNKEIILNMAKSYLQQNNIKYVEPGELGSVDGDKQEVIFLEPLMLDPNVAIVIPEDIRVWVNVKTKEATWIVQM